MDQTRLQFTQLSIDTQCRPLLGEGVSPSPEMPFSMSGSPLSNSPSPMPVAFSRVTSPVYSAGPFIPGRFPTPPPPRHFGDKHIRPMPHRMPVMGSRPMMLPPPIHEGIPPLSSQIGKHFHDLRLGLVPDILCSHGKVHEELTSQLMAAVKEITAQSLNLSLEEQCIILKDIAALLQDAKCHTEACYYLLACAGFIVGEGKNPAINGVAKFVREHTTLPLSTAQSTSSPKKITSRHLTNLADSIKMEGMIRLAYIDSQMLLDELNKESLLESISSLTERSSESTYTQLKKTLDRIHSTPERLSGIPPYLGQLLDTAVRVHRLNTPSREAPLSPSSTTS